MQDEAVRSAARRRNIIYAVVLLAYVLLNAFLVVRHENWRDEAQAWLLARDLSIPELIAQMSYEGHPCLWHLLLMPLAKLGLPYISMNVLSLTIMAVTAALLLWKAPLPLPIKILALFGCAFSYYYPVISRSYCLVPLFAALMAIFYRDRREKPLRYGLSVALMVQTHIAMLGMAAAASLVWLGEAVHGYRRDRDRRRLLAQGAGLTLPLLSFLFLLAQLSNARASTGYTVNLGDLLYFPQAALGLYMTAASFLGPLRYVALAAAALVVAFFFVRMLRKRAFGVLKAFIVAAAAVLYHLGLYAVLHKGHVMQLITMFFVLLWFFWVAWPKARDAWLRRVMALAMALLFAASYAAYPNVVRDIRHPFSGAEDCAAFIKDNLPAQTIFLEVNEPRTSAILPYLSEDYTFYSPYSGQPVTYVTWDRDYFEHLRLNDYESICAWALEVDPTCESICLIALEADAALEMEMLAQLEPYLTDEALLYRSAEADSIGECFALYSIPIVQP